jgi:hypothetical protein
MPVKVHDFWDNIQTSHLLKNHGIYKLKDFGKLPDTPGLYSWHINFSAINNDHYFQVFKQKKVKVNINGNLKENYLGEIYGSFDTKDFDTSILDHDLCEYASYAFCPPLYIGISGKLQTRLTQHYTELEKIYVGKKIIPPTTTIRHTELDTALESSHFAERIGYILNKLKNIKLDDIFVKTIELDSSYSWTDLQKVEKYLNRTFIPIYGRK